MGEVPNFVGYTLEETPLQPVRVRAVCECGGEVVFAGITSAAIPEKSLHKCRSCGNKYAIEGIYPRTIYREEK